MDAEHGFQEGSQRPNLAQGSKAGHGAFEIIENIVKDHVLRQ
jgi:hypothetical protein